MVDDKFRVESERKFHSGIEISTKLKIQQSDFFQIDFMKCFMMVLVILDHATTHSYMLQFYSPLWQRIAIPLFLVIMGFNMGVSFKRKGFDNKSLKEMYSKKYFKSKLQRYIIPYVVIYLAMTATYFIVANLRIPTISNYPYDAQVKVYLGYPLWWGPGLFFIPVIFTSILIFPLLYKAFSKHAFLTVAATFAIEISMQIVLYVLYHNVNLWPLRLPSRNFFTNHVLFFFSAIGMGLWLSKSKDHTKISWRSILILCLLPMSWIYISVYAVQSLGAAREIFNLVWLEGDYNFMAFPYSAFIFIMGMVLLPSNPQNKLFSKICNFIRRISKSTYHILLFQIFYFSFAYNFYFNIYVGFDSSPANYAWHFPLSLVIIFAGGMIWYEIENRFYNNKDNNIKLQRLYSILFSGALIFFIIRFISQFWLFIDNPVPDFIHFWDKLWEFFRRGFTLD